MILRWSKDLWQGALLPEFSATNLNLKSLKNRIQNYGVVVHQQLFQITKKGNKQE